MDKIVRVWKLTEDGKFVGKPEESIRVPIGPGPGGQIDSIAFSSDGRWLAIGGYASLSKNAASFRDPGFKSTLGSNELLEMGTIYLLDRTNNSFKRLEGHRGVVKRLVFARASDGSDQLISAGDDTDAKQQKMGSIRTWNVATGKQIDGVLLPESPKNRPSLSAMPSLSPNAGLKILASWGNEKLYQWESLKPPQLRNYKDGRNNNLLVSSPDSTWVATASADNLTEEGKLTFWNINSDGLPEFDARRTMAFRKSGDESFLPLGLTLLARSPEEKEDCMAVVLCVFKSGGDKKLTADRFQLRILTVPTADGASTEIMRKDLWKVDSNGIQVPELAASAKGRHLAIAGNPNQEILVFAIKDLMKSNFQSQQLVGRASVAQQIGFVEREGNLGLSIVEKSFEFGGQPSKYIFDIQNARIDSIATPHWNESKPNAKGWTVRQEGQKLIVTDQGRVVHTVGVPNRHRLSAWLLTTPIEATKLPLLVVAAEEQGQPWLGVFDMKDGVLKREFHAHTGMIAALAVSRDSRFLATASFDQTIAVWDLSDTEMMLRPRSTIKGIAFIEGNQGVEVDVVQEIANASLKVGDRMLGYMDPVRPDLFHPWPKVLEDKEPLWKQKPGTKLTVRRQRGTDVSDVLVVLDQQADERKPLFQLMITRKDSNDSRQWIGWSPLGPFDASDIEIRQRLGWHFNEPRPKGPLAFAPVDQYPNLFQPGFLSNAVKTVGRPPEVIPIAFSDPQMNLQISESEQWNNSGLPVVRQTPQSVAVQISNPLFPTEMIRGITLLVDNKVLGAFRPNGKDNWLFDSFELTEWKRGTYRFQAELETRTVPSHKFVVESQLVYIPNGPTMDTSVRPVAMTKESTANMATVVKSSQSALPIDVVLFRVTENEGREVAKTWETNEQNTNELRIEIPLELSVGRNRFVLEALNKGATEETKPFEKTTWKFDIHRLARDSNPPKIELTSFRELTDSHGVPDAINADQALGSGEILVASEQAMLSGRILANEKLTSATIGGEDIKGFQSDTVTDFAFQIPVRLQPGYNAIRIASKTGASPESTLDLNVLFRQALPSVEIVQPIGARAIESLLSPAIIQMKAVFHPSQNLRPISAFVSINGSQLNQPLSVDLKAGEIQGDIPLSLGLNTLQLHLSNDTGAKIQSTPLTFSYQPTPIVEELRVPEEIDGTTFDIRLTGKSASPIERLLMDGREIPHSKWQSKESGTQFTVDVADLPCQTDQRQFSLAVFATGVVKPAFTTIEMPKRKLPARPPTLAFLSPSENASITSELVSIEYLVRSAANISNVELLHDGQPIPIPIPSAIQDGDDSVLRERIEVRLHPGTNLIQLFAENKDGLTSRSLALNYVPSPVEIELDSITSFDQPNVSQKLSLRSDGTWRLDKPVDSSQNVLKGRIRWNYKDETAINESSSQIWISVNGFKQAVRLLNSAPNSLERRFEGKVHFFRTQDNVIEVLATDLRRSSTARKEVRVDCQSPELPRQRLHLVIIGVGVQPADESALVKDAVTSLAGNDLRQFTGKFLFNSPAFTECIGYGPFTRRETTPGRIKTILYSVNRKIQQLEAREHANDVMLVYFRGGEQVDLGGQFYLTTQQARDSTEAELLRTPIQLADFAVSSEYLSNFVNHCPGTQLLLLDVTRSTLSKNVANNYFIPGAATFRHAWLKGGSVPSDARLISAWQVTPQRSRLRDIEDQLSIKHVQLSQRYQDALRYENNIPEVMRELVLGDSN